MRHSQLALAGVFSMLAAAAIAHQGVKNPDVKARMEAMSAIAESTRILGTMAKGAVLFDAMVARTAAEAIADQASETTTLFEAPESDPVSKALPAIWDNYAEFSSKAEALEAAARKASEGISTPDDLRQALAKIGKTCKSCHGRYRK